MSEPRPRIFLIDGSSYIFRAFFAIPPLSNARGLPTNAILGFTNMLLRLVKQHRPEYIAVLLGHRTGAPDLEKVRVLFNELGFFNLLKLLEFNQPA